MFLSIVEDALHPSKKEQELEKAQSEHRCVCGRKVCCGKHKNGQCACHKVGRERD